MFAERNRAYMWLPIVAESKSASLCWKQAADVNAEDQGGATPLLSGLSRGTIARVPHSSGLRRRRKRARDMQGRSALMFPSDVLPENDAAAQSILHRSAREGRLISMQRDTNGRNTRTGPTDYKRKHLAGPERSYACYGEARSKNH